MKKIVLYILFLGILAASCYDDLGNYDYDESINDLTVEINKVYGVRKVDTAFVIRPVIRQTHRTDKSNLRYVWTVSEDGQVSGDTLSHGDTLTMVIDPAVSKFVYKYYIRFYIQDTITGAEQMFPLTLNVAKPYEGTWMVLHSQDGNARLGSVEYVGDGTLVTNDAYFRERGERLKGNAVGLGVRTYNLSGVAFYWGYGAGCVFYCFTDNEVESGELRQDKNLELYGNMKKIIYPNDYPDFNPNDIRYIEEGQGSLLLSGGHVFQGSIYGPRMYEMLPADVVKGDYDITHAASGNKSTHLAFDSKGHRFLHCPTVSNLYTNRWKFVESDHKSKMEPVVKDPGNVPGVNLDNIGEDQEMVYMGMGYWYGRSATIAPWQRVALYAYTKSKSSNKSYVYEFHAYPLYNRYDKDDIVPFTGYFTINTPAGVTTQTPMASSYEFNRILFYAVDNRIYRLDFGATGGISALIYQHPEGGAVAKRMKMAKDRETPDLYADYDHSPARSLGIIFDMPDGTGELVVLNLNNSGKVDGNGKFPAIQRHSESPDGKKFGKIKSIAFI